MHKQIVFFLAVSEEFLSLIPFANYPFTLYKLEIRVSQNLAKVGGGGGRPIKCQGWKGKRIGVNCPNLAKSGCV